MDAIRESELHFLPGFLTQYGLAAVGNVQDLGRVLHELPGDRAPLHDPLRTDRGGREALLEEGGRAHERHAPLLHALDGELVSLVDGHGQPGAVEDEPASSAHLAFFVLGLPAASRQELQPAPRLPLLHDVVDLLDQLPPPVRQDQLRHEAEVHAVLNVLEHVTVFPLVAVLQHQHPPKYLRRRGQHPLYLVRHGGRQLPHPPTRPARPARRSRQRDSHGARAWGREDLRPPPPRLLVQGQPPELLGKGSLSPPGDEAGIHLV